MKRVKLLTTALLLACVMAGCGQSTGDDLPASIEAHPIFTDEPIVIPSASESDHNDNPGGEESKLPVASESIITDRTVVDGKMQSYLTGEWKDVAVSQRRPMAVMIPNNKQAMPQYGISLASVIYEAPVEGRITRLMAFFEDYDELDHIGPVRSSRDYYVYEAMGFDAIYCNWGLAVPFVEDLLKSDIVDNVSQAVTGIHNPSPEAFDRIDRNGYKLEYTGYLFMNGYKKAVERQGYETEYREAQHQATFTFANDGYRSEYADHPSATKIMPGGTQGNKGGYGSHRPYFEYNEADGLYYRYQYDAAQVDEYNGEQIKVSNVVFKVCEGVVREPVKNDYLFFNCYGTGDAYIFTNGKVIKGTWRREGLTTNANKFYDENGNEIIFNQGKTWICNIWQDYESYMSYE